jgi:hypothetical protein
LGSLSHHQRRASLEATSLSTSAFSSTSVWGWSLQGGGSFSHSTPLAILSLGPALQHGDGGQEEGGGELSQPGAHLPLQQEERKQPVEREAGRVSCLLGAQWPAVGPCRGSGSHAHLPPIPTHRMYRSNDTGQCQ